MLSARHFRETDVVDLQQPAEEVLRGRGLLVRIKQGTSFDAAFMMYAPPRTSPGAEGISQRLYEWARQRIKALRARCTPVVILDANSRLDFRDDGVAGSADDPAVFDEYAEIFRSFLLFCRHTAVNTWYPQPNAGATYYRPVQGVRSRIDYICVPTALLSAGRVPACRVHHSAGDALQHARVARRLDHRPVEVRVDLTLRYRGRPQPAPRWQFDWIARALRGGPERASFVAAVEERLAQEGDWEADASTRWRRLQCTVVQEARSRFAGTGPRGAQVHGLRAAQMAALEKRRRFRPALMSRPPPGLVRRNDRLIFFEAWKVVAQLDRCTREYKGARRQEQQEIQGYLEHELHDAWRRRDLSGVWRMARDSAGTQVGPKRRRYDHMQVEPERESWAASVRSQGPAGGCGALLLEVDDIDAEVQRRRVHLAAEIKVGELLEPTRLVRDVHFKMRKSKARRQPPGWDMSAELWRMLLEPQRYHWEDRAGVGAASRPTMPGTSEQAMQEAAYGACPHQGLRARKVNAGSAGNALFQRRIVDVYAAAIAQEELPASHHVSQAFHINKGNGKPGCAGRRILHTLEPMAKAVLRAAGRMLTIAFPFSTVVYVGAAEKRPFSNSC